MLKKLLSPLLVAIALFLSVSPAFAVPIGIDGRRDKVDSIGASEEAKRDHWVNFFIYNGSENKECKEINSGTTGGYNSGNVPVVYFESQGRFGLDAGALGNSQTGLLGLVGTVNFSKCKDEAGNEFAIDKNDKISFNMYRIDADGTKKVASSISPIPIANPTSNFAVDAVLFHPDNIKIETTDTIDPAHRAAKDLEVQKDNAAASGSAVASQDYNVPLSSFPDKPKSNCASLDDIDTAIGCINGSPIGLVTAVLRIATGIAGGLAFMLMVYGSFVMITSSGNPDNILRGRNILTAAIAGLLVILLSVFILRFFGINILKLPSLTTPVTAPTPPLNGPARSIDAQ